MDDKQIDVVSLRRTAGEARKHVVLMRVMGLLAVILTVIIAIVYAASYFYNRFGSFTVRCKFEIVDLRSQITRIEADLREIRVAGTRIPIRECLTVSASSAVFRSNPRIKKTNSAK